MAKKKEIEFQIVDPYDEPDMVVTSSSVMKQYRTTLSQMTRELEEKLWIGNGTTQPVPFEKYKSQDEIVLERFLKRDLQNKSED